MSSILLCATPNHGHVNAVMDVGRQLLAAGHRVRMLTGSRHIDRVKRAGIEPIALTGDADVDLDNPNDVFPERTDLRGLGAIRFDLLHLFVEPLAPQYRALRAAIGAEPTDAILVEPTFAAASLLLEEPRGERPTVVVLGILPCPLPGPGLAPFGMGLRPWSGIPGTLRDQLLDVIFTRVLVPVEERRREIEREIGRRVPGEKLMHWAEHADLFLQLTVPSFEYPRPPRDGFHFVGPTSRNLISDTELPAWWPDLDRQRPVIHVTQGTLANKDLTQLIQPSLEALADTDALVVVSLGGRPVDDLPGPVPPNARIASYLPYDALLPKTDLLITNGGYTTVQLALSHGIPMVVAGRTEDKAEVATRVEWSGVGIRLGTDTPRPRRIRRAVTRVLTTSRYRERVETIAAEMADAPGVSAIEALLADAKG